MNYPKIARNITLTLLITQSLGTAAVSVTGTVNTIVGAELSGTPSLAGLPGAVVQIGSAVASFLLGATMDRTGRRLGLGSGIALGILGSLIAVLSILSGSFLFFLLGMMLFGAARAGMQLGRFAAAEVHPPESRGRAISYVVLGGVFGAVLGPQLASPAGQLARQTGLPELAGPYAVGLLTFFLATTVIFTFLRPDPRDIGRDISRLYPETARHTGPTRRVSTILRTPTAFTAMIVMVAGQVVMVGLMGITSLHMKNNNHELSAIAIVFSAHTLGMFAFSIVTGRLADKWGRGRVILSGTAMLFAAGVLAPLSTAVAPLAVALFLLGLGWNFCYVGGSALLSDVLSPEERAKTQGANDLLISLSTAVASFSSGVVFAGYGYTAIGIIAALLAVVPFVLSVRWTVVHRKAVLT